MKKVLLFGVLLVAGLFIIGFFGRRQGKEVADVVKPESTVLAPVAKSDAGEGGVTVTAQPVVIDTEDIVFEFTIDTHSGDLTNFSVLEKVSLVSGGKATMPKDWQEAASSVHHRSGKLVFEKIGTSEMELVVKDLAGVPERKLKWTL